MAFEGKVVLITGASSGIGVGTAILFAEQGAKLAITGRNEERLRETLGKCKSPKSGRSNAIIVADVTKEDDAKKIINNTIAHFGQLDVLVNNAGILEGGSIENTSLEQYDSIMNTNVRSVYHLTMLAVPHLIKTKGNIVNVSSVAGTRSFPNILAYGMSKSAVDQFTKCTALELAPKQVRVNAVNPGVIVTDIHKRGGMDDKAYEEFLERGRTTHALGRVGTVDEVAEGIVFLASDRASFITGANLPICGGRHIMCPR
ncbi:3-oxoacyl-[acyl-carrier-protein] reductase FabG-like [Phlebotomus papatasi]|uniref:3-oxoacyl-[acyl-carrier-protein] reductase FabG-like n=1 Tax=Phlebotomus papatasi TaxID=29031 RepID=UPI0024835844|nr:3-oxoacyl-[acyl-carrier-protein] reductase FabG-like [Phlebotomus papatasi]